MAFFGLRGTGIVALVMHSIVYGTGGLYLAMAIRVVYDLMLGLIAMRQFTQDRNAAGMEPQPVSAGG
jgi:hypothetical protein